MGKGAIQLNGELLDPERTRPSPRFHPAPPGHGPLYFVDIQRSFMEENIPESLRFKSRHWFKYPDQQALHPFSAKAGLHARRRDGVSDRASRPCFTCRRARAPDVW